MFSHQNFSNLKSSLSNKIGYEPFTKKLNLIILVGPFQLTIFCDSLVILSILVNLICRKKKSSLHKQCKIMRLVLRLLLLNKESETMSSPLLIAFLRSTGYLHSSEIFKKRCYSQEYSKTLISNVNVSSSIIVLWLLLIRICLSFAWQWN